MNFGTKAFQAPKNPSWNEGKAVFMIEDNFLYLSKQLLKGLNLEKESRVTFGNSEGKTYICNVTNYLDLNGNKLEEKESFRVTGVSGNYKGSSRCRNKELIGHLLNPNKFGLVADVEYTIQNIQKDGLYTSEVVVLKAEDTTDIPELFPANTIEVTNTVEAVGVPGKSFIADCTTQIENDANMSSSRDAVYGTGHLYH